MNGNNGGQDDDAILSAENEGMDEAVGHPRDTAPHPAMDILAEQITALEKERDELKDNMLRALAETDNVRKRANRQIEEARLYAVEKFARDLLNVSDNLSRAVESVPAGSRGIMTDAVKTALEGVELTQKELVSVLSRHGVTAIDASPGAAFDPALHQAVTQVPSEHPAGSVAQLFQSGWRIGDRTLRAAMVAVSAGGVTKQ
jgi:molecular chaperone GrpE